MHIVERLLVCALAKKEAALSQKVAVRRDLAAVEQALDK